MATGPSSNNAPSPKCIRLCRPFVLLMTSASLANKNLTAEFRGNNSQLLGKSPYRTNPQNFRLVPSATVYEVSVLHPCPKRLPRRSKPHQTLFREKHYGSKSEVRPRPAKRAAQPHSVQSEIAERQGNKGEYREEGSKLTAHCSKRVYRAGTAKTTFYFVFDLVLRRLLADITRSKLCYTKYFAIPSQRSWLESALIVS